MDAIGFGAAIALTRLPRSAVFDFTRGVLPPGARLTRGSAATLSDASGAVTSVASDVARFERDSTGAWRGLLIEPAASNAISWSSDWTRSYWSKINLDPTAPAALIETASATTAHAVRQASGDLAYLAGQPVTASLIASERSGSAKRYLVIAAGAAPTFADATLAIFDLASGTVTAASNVVAAGASAIGGGAWLCWVTVLPVAAGSGVPIVLRLNAIATAVASYAGDGASGLNVSHVQVETGSAASSRIVTTSAAGSRAADVLVLDWRALGVPDGAVTLRYGFDDGSGQDVAAMVSGGSMTVPTTLARPRLRFIRKL